MYSTSISILGSTGSIGKNTLKVVDHLGNVEVVAIAAGSNVKELASQVVKYRPELVSCKDETSAEELCSQLSETLDANQMPRVLTGEEGLVAVACHSKVGTVVSATVGAVGFVPTLKAIEAGKRIALANKETLVMAGELMTRAASESGAELVPVDSEHNALHQCLRGADVSEVRRLVLTASGGPFREKSLGEIKNATVAEALDHPTWDMGDKISIDSATLMNKGLEVIEAHWLFGFAAEQIDVVVHPQSVVHSMVEMVDGSIISQMGVTDMKHAIQYALTYPERLENCLPLLNFADIPALTFEKPDTNRFPNLELAYKALEMGGTASTVLNASNEVAVQAFLEKKIRLDEVFDINRESLNSHNAVSIESLGTVLESDKAARKKAAEFVKSRSLAASAADTV